MPVLNQDEPGLQRLDHNCRVRIEAVAGVGGGQRRRRRGCVADACARCQRSSNAAKPSSRPEELVRNRLLWSLVLRR